MHSLRARLVRVVIDCLPACLPVSCVIGPQASRMAAKVREKEVEVTQAQEKVQAVEDEMRVLLTEMAQQKQKISRLNRAFADLQP